MKKTKTEADLKLCTKLLGAEPLDYARYSEDGRLVAIAADGRKVVLQYKHDPSTITKEKPKPITKLLKKTSKPPPESIKVPIIDETVAALQAQKSPGVVSLPPKVQSSAKVKKAPAPSKPNPKRPLKIKSRSAQ